MAVFFTVQFESQSNRQIRILRRGCQENIAILDLTAFVVFKSLPKTKSVDLISKRTRGQSGK